jgi:hypothetical protein
MKAFFALLVMTCPTSTAGAAGLTLSMQDGLDVSGMHRMSLREFSPSGNVSVKRASSTPSALQAAITLKLDAAPEKQALDIILRSIPGYMALPRVTRIADASLYERVLIMATTTQVAPLRAQQPPPATFPGRQGAQGGASVTQLRPGVPQFPPGMLVDPPDQADQLDDPAMALLPPPVSCVPGSVRVKHLFRRR